MTKLPISHYFPNASSLAYGCMGLGGGWDQNPVSDADLKTAHQVIDASLESGINFFDHADIYTFGKAEQVFGQALRQRPELREQMIIQSKCGIRFEDDQAPGRYDFSQAWITHSVENILKRLGVEQLDILLLHRPDPLMEPEIVAEAFRALKASGKVAHFGVSNMSRYQVEFLQQAVKQPLIANQLEISLAKLDWLDEGVMVGNAAGQSLNFAPGTLEYCRQHGVQLQAWGSLAQGMFSGRDVSSASAAVKQTATLVSTLAEKYQVSREAVALGWLMRHPARIQPVIGTTSVDRIKASAQAMSLELSREDWYKLYVSARGNPLP